MLSLPKEGAGVGGVSTASWVLESVLQTTKGRVLALFYVAGLSVRLESQLKKFGHKKFGHNYAARARAS
jgi:hypothetical protein